MSRIQIKKINFLVPVQVQLVVDGVERLIRGEIDCVNKKFYGESGFEQHIFKFLNKVTTLPEDAFEASEEIYEEAGRAKDHFEAIHSENVGED